MPSLLFGLVLLSSFAAPTAFGAGEGFPGALGKLADFITNWEAYHEEGTLRIEYELDCRAAPPGQFHGLLGSLTTGNVTRFFELLEGETTVEIGLGPWDESMENSAFEISRHRECSLKTYTLSLLEEDVLTRQGGNPFEDREFARKLALRHSPFLVIRRDARNMGHRLTDVPMTLAYSIMPPTAGGIVSIRYTTFFSDEDSKPSREEAAGQMGRYGRYGDIEWTYEVELSSDLRPLRREFHSGLFKNFSPGHRTHKFTGQFLPGSQHPVLGVIGNHNVFSDKVNGLWVGHQLLARDRIDSPQARETLLFRRPSLMRVSDEEMIRENKSQGYAIDYLYVLIDGALEKGSLLARVSLPSGETFLSGDGRTEVDRLGEDLWGKQAYTAIPLGRDRLAQLGKSTHGQLWFTSKQWVKPRLRLSKELRFFRVVSREGRYSVEEITDLFHRVDAGWYRF